MKTAIFILCLVAIASAFPKRENKWHPAGKIDWSKFKPVDRTVTVRHPENILDVVREIIKSEHAPTTKGKISMKRADKCGISQAAKKIDPFIVGGTVAEPHEFPWQVNIFMDFSYFCGGSVISDEWILTAAHCVDGFRHFDVNLGMHDRTDDSELGHIAAEAEEAYAHPDYNPTTLHNDIALLRVPKIKFNEYIQPVCLPCRTQESESFVGEDMTVSGWGRQCDQSGSQCGLASELRKVTRPIITNSACNSIYGIITPDHICISTTGGKGTCNGDSGGPLQMMDVNEEFYTQFGVVSFGSSAGCEKGYPAGFTRVSKYLDFIGDKTGIEILE